MTSLLVVATVGVKQQRAGTRARTSATSVASLDTGPACADHPHPTQLLRQPEHLELPTRVASLIHVAMLSPLLNGASPKLKKPSLVEPRSIAGAPNVIIEKGPTILTMSQPTMTPGGLRCRPNDNRSQTTARQLQPLRASWTLLLMMVIG